MFPLLVVNGLLCKFLCLTLMGISLLQALEQMIESGRDPRINQQSRMFSLLVVNCLPCKFLCLTLMGISLLQEQMTESGRALRINQQCRMFPFLVVNCLLCKFLCPTLIEISLLQFMTGHTLGVVGALEAITTTKAITTGWLHPTINQFVSCLLAWQFFKANN